MSDRFSDDVVPLGPWAGLRYARLLADDVGDAAVVVVTDVTDEPDAGPLYDDLASVLAAHPTGQHSAVLVCLQCLRTRIDAAIVGGDARALPWWHQAHAEVLCPVARA